MQYYKIRSKSNPEMFRKADGAWNKSGKVYDTLGKLRALITTKLTSYYPDVRKEVDNWEIVEFEVREVAVKSVNDVVTPKTLLKVLAQQNKT